MQSNKLHKISWGILAIEAGAIFLSVLLGFAVSEWRQESRNDDICRQALENFRTELADNQREIEARLPYHTGVLEGLRTVVQSGEVPRSFAEMSEQSGFNGPSVAFLQQTALRTADVTGALALLDYQTTKTVTAVYELQRLLQLTQEAIANAALNPMMFAPDNLSATMVSLMTYFEIVVEYENALMLAYPDVLAHLDAQLGTATGQARNAADTSAVGSP